MDYSDDEQSQASTSTKKWVPTAEKPYKCEVPGCNAAYKQHNGLKYHKTHGKCFSRYGQRDDQQVPYTCYDQELCRKKYRNMNGLRYHYQHSERHGVRGMTMLQDGTHPPFPRLGKNGSSKQEEEDSPESTSTSSHQQPEQSDSSSGLSEPETMSSSVQTSSRPMLSMLSMTSMNEDDDDHRFVATPINGEYAEGSVSPFSSSEDSMLDEQEEEIKPSPSSTNQLLEAIDFLSKQDEHYQISASLPASQFYLPSGIGPSRTSYRRNGAAAPEMAPPAQYHHHPYPVVTRPRSNTNPMISAIRRASF